MKNYIGAIVLCAIAFSLGIWLSPDNRAPLHDSTANEDASPQGALAQPIPLPNFNVVDENGLPFSNKDFLGQWSLLFFGYTNCPDICPITLQIAASAMPDLPKSISDENIRLYLVTLDPMRDTPEKLKQYVSSFGPDLHALGGTLEQVVLGFAKGMNIPYRHTPSENAAGYDVDHPASLFLVDPKARLAGILQAPHTVDSIKKGLEDIAGYWLAHEPGLSTSPRTAAQPTDERIAGGGAVSVANPWVRKGAPGMDTPLAAYLRLRNDSNGDLRLVGVESPDFKSVELHESRLENDIAMMRKVETLPLPQGVEVKLSPGGLHLMLHKINNELDATEAVTLILHFSDGSSTRVRAPILKASEAPF
ncbi:MAG: SCO family protein [Candidatus Eutrophobiaceae bacterium]